jgi:hypothetical protein
MTDPEKFSAASYQGAAWLKYTRHYLAGVDPHLPAVFDRALGAAGYPECSAATALEHLCADFLAGRSAPQAPQP